jgi:protein arginine N-methyltransferase 1
MYSLDEYGLMIADKVRMDAYAYALKELIEPGSVVLDIGAGTGIHALLACKFGARQVYAIEPNDAIFLARQLAQSNGFSDRIQFIQDISTRVTIPEKANIIVSDLRGVLPMYGNHIPSIIDARERHLAPDGRLIPRRDTLWVSLVETNEYYKDLLNPWDLPYGLVMEEVKQIVVNSWSDDNTDTLRTANLLTEPQIWAILDYTTINNPNVRHPNIVQKATRDGTAHGLLLWFDAEIVEGINLFNGPGAEKAAEAYGCGFLPLLEPVSVSKGDLITLVIQANLIGGQYVWHWSTHIYSPKTPHTVKADYRQSTSYENDFYINPIKEQASSQKPSLCQEGKIDYFILGKLDGRTSLEKIAQQVLKRFPSRFKDLGESILYVHNLSQGFSQ